MTHIELESHCFEGYICKPDHCNIDDNIKKYWQYQTILTIWNNMQNMVVNIVWYCLILKTLKNIVWNCTYIVINFGQAYCCSYFNNIVPDVYSIAQNCQQYYILKLSSKLLKILILIFLNIVLYCWLNCWQHLKKKRGNLIVFVHSR